MNEYSMLALINPNENITSQKKAEIGKLLSAYFRRFNPGFHISKGRKAEFASYIL